MNADARGRTGGRTTTSIAAVAFTALAAMGMSDCPGSRGTPAIDRDTLTQRQKDSIVAEMPIPGAGGVGRALEATDRIDERNARLDSIR